MTAMTEDFVTFAAPLQGVTGYPWRNAHAEVFPGITAYLTPFLRIEHGEIRKKGLKDISTERNTANIIPQVLAGTPDETARLAEKVRELGYQEVNLNLGCPHPPVARHHRGCGLLQSPDEIKALFERLREIEGLKFSVKMRLGYADETEWRQVLPYFSILSPTSVTVHPRIGRQLYSGELHLAEFERLLGETDLRVLYNGDIQSLDDVNRLREKYPRISGVMAGRGLVANPALFCPTLATRENMRRFHTIIYDEIVSTMEGGEHQILSHLKEMWLYFMPGADKKALKTIKKCTSLQKYNDAVNTVLGR